MKHKVFVDNIPMSWTVSKSFKKYFLLALITAAIFSILSCQKELSYESSTPTILSLSPTSGAADSTIIISGLNFNTVAANDTVKFNGFTAIVSSATANQLTVTVPDSATTGYITLTIGSYNTTSPSIFTVTTDTFPHITSFTPTTGTSGTTVVITGTNFSTTVANNKVMFNGVTATVTAATTTQLTVTVPSSTATGAITVTVGTNTATSSSSFIIN